jgi:hypothetical protein
VPDLIVLEYLVNVIAVLNSSAKNLYTSFTTFFRNKSFFEHQEEVRLGKDH